VTYRQLFHEIMFYGSFDRMPVLHWTGWPETLERWYQEGLPRDVNQHEFFAAQPWCCMIWTNLSLHPSFEEKTIEETEAYRIFRDRDGVVQQQWKGRSSIPHYIDFTLKNARDWPDYKKRLQPHPERIPADIDQRLRDAEKSGLPIVFHTASMMGWIRNWMGVENMCYLMYDDRDCYKDMIMTLADLTVWAMDQILPRIKADMVFGWEDICGRAGPLVSPEIFAECVAPGYEKIRRRAEYYGIQLYGIDSDGEISALLKPWLDAGVNVQFPAEVGPWQADGMRYRRQYGRNLRIIGHFDKLALERGRDAVRREIERLKPLMRDGGYIIMPDHLITPGVALADYRWYLDQIRDLRI